MARKPRIPSYRLHRASDQAVVVIDGRSFYLGKFGTPESKAEYRRIISEWLTNQRRPLPIQSHSTGGLPVNRDLTITELVVSYWEHVKHYYLKDGKPTSEQDTIRQALRFVRQSHGHSRAIDFGPLALKAVREAMIQHPVTRKVRLRDKVTGEVRDELRILRVGLARTYINKQVSRIRQMFKWATEQEILPITVFQALTTVPGLRKDRSTAREKEPVKPVPVEHVQGVLTSVPPTIATMIRVQELCGGRPQDMVEMKPCDIDRRGPVWEYHPGKHKNEHHDQERTVFLGPKAQQLLHPYLVGIESEDYVFSPSRSEATRLAELRQRRGLPMKESSPTKRRKSKLRDHYDAASYRRAIRRACVRIGVPIWFPLQLRHSAGTAIRKRYGLEASQAILGHAEMDVTQVYAEKNLDLARQVIAEIG